MSELIATFVFFFAVIDPIGTVPVFIAVTSRFDHQAKRRIASRAALVSAAVLLFFLVAGEIILTSIGIPLSAFRIAGGIVLFLFALSMIFGESKPEEEIKLVKKGMETAIFPLAVPSIASPGAMLTENSKHSISEQAVTALVMMSVLLLTWALMMASTVIYRFIGDSGASIISRVMGLILSSVAVTSVLAGIRDYFGLVIH
jgi:multiple antibiotic resistance protein